MDIAGYSSRTGNFKRGLQRLLNDQLLELTIPDKPQSHLQKYRLTGKGRRILAGMQNVNEKIRFFLLWLGEGISFLFKVS